jgi:hypothetical protein
MTYQEAQAAVLTARPVPAGVMRLARYQTEAGPHEPPPDYAAVMAYLRAHPGMSYQDAQLAVAFGEDALKKRDEEKAVGRRKPSPYPS